MRDVLPAMLPDWRRGATAGLATVVSTFKSAPRLPGAAMLVTADGEAVGSVSGGCVVGLTCGGIIDIFVEPVSQRRFAELDAVAQDIAAGRRVGVATVIEHPEA